LANREALLRAPSREDLLGQSAWAALRAANEIVGKLAKSLILEYIYNKARTDFEQGHRLASLGGNARTGRAKKGVWGK